MKTKFMIIITLSLAIAMAVTICCAESGTSTNENDNTSSFPNWSFSDGSGSGLTWPDTSNWGTDGFSMDGFSEDWYGDFTMPEGFGEFNFDGFGNSSTGASWGSIDNSSMEDWAKKFDDFKNGLGQNMPSGNENAGNSSSFDDLKSAFESQQSSVEDKSSSDSSQDIKSLFSEKFSSENAYNPLEQQDLPFTVEDLKGLSTVEKPSFSAGDKQLDKIKSASDKINDKASDALKEKQNLPNMSKKYGNKNKLDIKGIYNKYENSLDSKVDKSNVNRVKNLYNGGASTVKNSAESNKSYVHSLYKNKNGDGNANGAK